MSSVVEQLQERNVKKITQQEAGELTKIYSLEKEYETGITEPIKVLNIEQKNYLLILESDQKGNNFIRLLKEEDLQEFISERQSVYDKMWDGCGCKVFYEEVWESAKNSEMKI